MSDKAIPRCSFCGKTQDQVRKLIAAPRVYICDECVSLSVEVLEGELGVKPWPFTFSGHERNYFELPAWYGGR